MAAKILCAVEPNDEARRVMRTAAAQGKARGQAVEVLYVVKPRGLSAEIDDTLMIAPPPDARIAGTAYFEVRNMLSTFTCMTRCQAS